MRLLEWYRKRDLLKIRPDNTESYPGFDKSKKFLLFYQYDQLPFSEVMNWQEILQKEGKQVDTIAFFPNKEKELPQDLVPNYFCRSDLSWWGRPKNDAFNDMISNKYDVFVDLSQGDHFAAQYVRNGSHASLKVNFGNEKKPWSHLQLDFNIKKQGADARLALLKILAFINK